jgi:competence protein ComEC
MRIQGAEVIEKILQSPVWSVWGWSSRIRQDLAERLVTAVPDDALPFVLTVWLGDRQRMDNETYATFVNEGVAHILAVSGLHIGITYITLMYGLRLTTTRARTRIIITLIAIALFPFLAGARISSLRVAIMVALYFSAEWFELEPDAPTALGLAGLFLASIILTLYSWLAFSFHF